MIKRVCSLETEYALVTIPAILNSESRDALSQRIERAILSDHRWARCNSFGRRSQVDTGARSLVEIREGYFVENGSRFYYDAGHFEWANPETIRPDMAVTYDKAAEQNLVDAVRQINQELAHSSPSYRILLVKNNIDYYSDASYGCHENYSLRRYDTTGGDIHDRLLADLIPFLVTRQIFTGAGRIGTRRVDQLASVAFQLSQRAEFMEQAESSHTREQRGLLNLRDEPLANERQWRRLHLILGDSNMSEFATYLKMGTTSLVLDLIEENRIRGRWALKEPVKAMSQVSRDWQGARLTLAAGDAATALEIQQSYCQQVTEATAGLPAGHFAHRIVESWQETLSDLAHNGSRKHRRLDWAIKRYYLFEPLISKASTDWAELARWEYVCSRTKGLRQPANDAGDALTWLKLHLPKAEMYLLEDFVQTQRLDWRLYWERRQLLNRLREMDFRYHDIDPQHGLYGLIVEDATRVDRIAAQQDIEAARRVPPKDTRAWQRGKIIDLCSELHIPVEMDWNKVLLINANRTIPMDDPFATELIDLHQISKSISPSLKRPATENFQIKIIGVEELGQG